MVKKPFLVLSVCIAELLGEFDHGNRTKLVWQRATVRDLSELMQHGQAVAG